MAPRLGASWQLAHKLDAWSCSLAPREQLSVWCFRSSCDLWLLWVELHGGGPGSFPDFWAGNLSGCQAVSLGCGHSRALEALGKVGSEGVAT